MNFEKEKKIHSYKVKNDQKTVEIAQCKKKIYVQFFSIGLCIRIEMQNNLYFIIIKFSENCEFEIAKINQF